MRMLKNKDFRFKNALKSDGTITGYLSTYGNVDRQGDIVVRGAFDESVKKKKIVPMCFNHDWNVVLGSLELSLDSYGLLAKGVFNLKDTRAKEIFDLVKMGALDSLSIGTLVEKSTPVESGYSTSGVKILKAQVWEGSIVTVPANPEAMISGNGTDVEKRLKLEKQLLELERKLGHSKR